MESHRTTTPLQPVTASHWLQPRALPLHGVLVRPERLPAVGVVGSPQESERVSDGPERLIRTAQGRGGEISKQDVRRAFGRTRKSPEGRQALVSSP